ncbi:C4-dicarboxylate ABC transporter substrate-binding protein [Marinobacterium nitratireducens]|uniref:C4-dicarboxylate ABC transporter substrate-binding protein n=1 Tax=Marinobacterium nitratireducens TaxID=518897 RepID=A0A917ZCJ3_9GAMM|nr:TAXI family TRAP transporter solute-binding subunit [Marinobacterium nitratireducens]GGO79957.1 C4-dicarboxylate ABC transporter substrate-binding protein [Marinobacterium nitratireducens]
MTKRFSRLVLSTILASTLAVLPFTTQARTLSIGTNPQGSVAYASGSAIADVVGDAIGTPFTVIPQGGPTAIIPAMTAGEFDFAFANVVAAATALDGKGPFKGRKFESLRVAAVVYPLHLGVYVKKDSPIKSFGDLRGQRVASAFKSQSNLAGFMTSALAMSGMSYDDVTAVPVQNGVQAMDELIDGGLDATIFSTKAGVVQKADAVVGVRALSVDSSDSASATLAERSPGAYVAEVAAGSVPGVAAPTNVIEAPFVVLTDSQVDEETVYQVVKALAENKDKLAVAASDFEALDLNTMGQSKLPVPYHPGAIRFYQEKGVWQ